MFVQFRFTGVWLAAVLTLPITPVFAEPPTLGLNQAVALALQQDPGIRQLQAEERAIQNQAVAVGQLPDPMLSLGIVNLPTNSFTVGRESMTMQTIGVQQDFPAGHTRALSEQRGRQMVTAQQSRIAERHRHVALNVREAWLQLYYANHAQQLVKQSEDEFTQLAASAKVRYANGNGSQQEWLRARLELADLKEQKLDLQNEARTARAALARYVGTADASRPLPDSLPDLPPPPSYADILDALPSHPLAAADNAEITAAQTSVDIAKQGYKPTWGVNLSYGHRPGGDPGAPFTDLFSAMLSVSLPIFAGDRQDKKVAAAAAEASASTYTRDNELRQLKRLLDTDWARWQQLQQLNTLYEKTILPDSDAEVAAGSIAYRNGGGDFFELVRSELDALNARMRRLKIATDTDSVKAALLYLSGEEP